MIKEFFYHRKLKRDLSGVNFNGIEAGIGSQWEEYRKSEEYNALLWLKAYLEGRASSDPKHLLIAIITKHEQFTKYDQDFCATLLRHI